MRSVQLKAGLQYVVSQVTLPSSFLIRSLTQYYILLFYTVQWPIYSICCCITVVLLLFTVAALLSDGTPQGFTGVLNQSAEAVHRSPPLPCGPRARRHFPDLLDRYRAATAR